jgi:hypothetical protein
MGNCWLGLSSRTARLGSRGAIPLVLTLIARCWDVFRAVSCRWKANAEREELSPQKLKNVDLHA